MNLLMHPGYFPNCITVACLVQGQVTWEVWDNYQKQTYRNRCYIATDRGRLMLNIPIRHVGGSTGRQHYREVRIENSYPWQRQHWRSLQTAYRAAPFFEYYEADLSPLFETTYSFLLDLNLATIELVCTLLQRPFPRAQTTSFMTTPEGIQDARSLIDAKREDPCPVSQYTQVFQERHGFLPNLSVLDLLFNEGTGAVGYLKSIRLPWNA
ncbi:MAG: WbqC family protein [Robiginitalea sp.]